MLQTLSGWVDNAMDQLRLLWGEPLTWLILAVAVGFALWRSAQPPRWRLTVAAAYLGAVAWLLATLAITIYPIDVSFEPTPGERFDIEAMVPLAGTIQSLDNMRDRTWSPEGHAAMTAKIADDLGIPPEEVNLSWRIHGTSPAGVLRDPLGNLLLFIPLGLVAALASRQVSWRQVAIAAAAISATIEASQLVFGFGSLASIDDVIFNTTGAIAGLAAYRFAQRTSRRLPSTPTRLSSPSEPAPNIDQAQPATPIT